MSESQPLQSLLYQADQILDVGKHQFKPDQLVTLNKLTSGVKDRVDKVINKRLTIFYFSNCCIGRDGTRI